MAGKDRRIAEHITDADAIDWTFVRSLDATFSVNIVDATQSLFARLKDHRSELETILQEVKQSPDYTDITLDSFFDSRPATFEKHAG
jgi:hypothetical protein